MELWKIWIMRWGKHEDKQRINYKDEGDGFLVDSVAESGYTYCFFFHNQPAPICMSFYDAKDVYFMSTSATEIKWAEKERHVYNKEAQKVVSMKFLRPKIVDNYNNGMNKVDQADQLRSSYGFDLWTRKRKWWWAIWLWGIQVSLVNSFVMYRAAHLYIWKRKESSLLSHYNFQKMVALHLLNSE